MQHWPIWQSVAIAMVIINFFLAACKGDSLLYHCNCKGHNLLGTTIAGVIINYTLGLASSHYNSGPGRKLAQGCWLTDRVFSKGGKPSSFGKSDRVFSIFVWSGWSGGICGLLIASRSTSSLHYLYLNSLHSISNQHVLTTPCARCPRQQAQCLAQFFTPPLNSFCRLLNTCILYLCMYTKPLSMVCMLCKSKIRVKNAK